MAKPYIPYDGPVVTRESALIGGGTRFFDGIPCANGHISQRLVSRSKCVACGDARSARHRAKKKAQYEADNPEIIEARLVHKSVDARKSRRNALLAKWREKNREKLREYTSEWSSENRDKVKGYSDARKGKKHEYDRDRYARDPQSSKDKAREWRGKNGEKVLENVRKWQLANPDRRKAIANNWKAANRYSVCADARRRYAQERRATPAWADIKEILDIYEECARITRDTGILHHVDHVMPLRGKNICGLHIASNLRILEAKENMKKGNRLIAELAAAA